MCLSNGRRHVQTGVARSNSTVIMFNVDVTTCVALFQTNVLHLKLFDK